MKRYQALILLVILSLLITAAALPQQVQAPYLGMWINAEELAKLPTTGAAWNALKAAADKTCTPDLSNQDDNCDQYTLAAALVYARTGEGKYRTAVLTALARLPESENGGRTLALGRNLAGYVIAADLVNLPADEGANAAFVRWLSGVRQETLDGRTLITTHEERPNNWGTMAGASRIAAALYLGDEADLDRAALVFRGWLGDTAAYSGFEFGELSWQCDPDRPVGINPDGCTIAGKNVGGAQPEEMRRGGAFADPPKPTGYPWEALQGAVVQAVLLERAGYGALAWEDNAILRAVEYLYGIGWPAEGDDIWQVWLINAAYGTGYATKPAGHGKVMGWTDWTHASRNPAPPLPTARPTATPTPTPGDEELLTEIRGLRADIRELIGLLERIFK